MKGRKTSSLNLYRQSTILACLILIVSAITSIVNYQKKKKPILLYAFFSTFIASCFYIYFVFRNTVPIRVRYLDWILTTPLLLQELSILMNLENVGAITSVIILNLLVFVFGFLGEIGVTSRGLGCILGFIPLLLFFAILLFFGDYSFYLPLFFVVWSMYGITYLIRSNTIRNISYNILDVVSKGVFTLALVYL